MNVKYSAVVNTIPKFGTFRTLEQLLLYVCKEHKLKVEYYSVSAVRNLQKNDISKHYTLYIL